MASVTGLSELGHAADQDLMDELRFSELAGWIAKAALFNAAGFVGV
jgi:hypothetical protein